MIWIATIAGWSIYNPNTRILKNFLFPADRKEAPIIMNRINSFFEMEGGGVLIATGKGIIRTKHDGGFSDLLQVNQCVNLHDREYLLNSVNAILAAPGKPGKFLLCTSGGLLLYDTLARRAEQDYRWPNGADMMTKKMYLDSKKQLWVCGWGLGMSCFNLNSETWTYYSPFKSGLTTLDVVPKNKEIQLNTK